MSAFADEIIHLRNVGIWSGGGTPSKANPEYWDNGDIPWVSPKDMKTFELHDSQDKITAKAVEASPAKLVPAGSVLMVVRSGILAHTFPVAIARTAVTLNQDMKAITPKGGLSSEFLAYQLRAQESTILKSCTKSGTTVASVETKQLQSLPFWVPSAELQTRIVEELDKQLSRLEATVTTLQGIQTKLKQARASILKAAVEGRLVETEAELASKSDGNYITAKDQLRKHLASRRDKYSAKQRFRVRSSEYKEPVRPNMDGTLFRIPEGWEVATVDQLADGTERCLTDGPFGSNLKTSHYQESGPRVIRLQNIGDGIFRDERAHISVDHFNTLSKHSVTGGDIVIASLGEVLPRSCILPKEIGPAIVKADCIRFSPSNQAFNVSYINYALNSRPVRRLVASQIHGVGRPRIGLAGIRNICIPLPPYDEQCRIVAEIVRRFSVLDQVEAIVQNSLTRCGMLRQAILKRAFEERLMPAALRAISAGTKTVFND